MIVVFPTAKITKMLQDDTSRKTAVSILKNRHGHESPPSQVNEKCEHALNLAGRLLSMTNIGSMQDEVNSRRLVEWDCGSTLRQCLSAHFDRQHEMQWERTRLLKSFNPWGISVVAVITIRFTDNLANHLLLVEDDTMLLVFHHATFLEHQTDL